jgi:cyclopropane-fatty-acyl-phospholipid synthase
VGAIEWAESGRLPDPLVRLGIRRLLRQRLRALRRAERLAGPVPPAWLEALRRGPIAPVPGLANAQHYEVDAGFFESVLGPRLKYSACLWPEGVRSLDRAEEAMLALTCARARLEDGMRILDLGSGWGSLALWIAERYPRCSVLALSNSKGQRELVAGRAARRGLANLRCVTADVNGFAPGERFDRVVSVEMFEHARNWELLLARVAQWLEPEGRLFLHVFCHRRYSYPYEDRGRGDWMARNFFTGGIMPSWDLVRAFDRHLEVEERWRVDGRHYRRTADAWLRNLDAGGEGLERALEATYGGAEAPLWRRRWRLFFLACSELFGFRGGAEWHVGHYLLRPRIDGRSRTHYRGA